MLKQEIENKVLPNMEARLNNKIDTINKIVENKRLKIANNNKTVQICHLHCPVVLIHHQIIKQKSINIIHTSVPI